MPSLVPAGSRGPTTSDERRGDDERDLTDLVEQPAKVMRIGSMIRQLLEEVKAAPLDEASRNRLAGDPPAPRSRSSRPGLAPELVEELERLIAAVHRRRRPSEAELRIAQAQLVGWLEGLFHGIQTAIYAQQMAARAQLEQMRRALPAGALPTGAGDGPGCRSPAMRTTRGTPGRAGCTCRSPYGTPTIRRTRKLPSTAARAARTYRAG